MAVQPSKFGQLIVHKASWSYEISIGVSSFPNVTDEASSANNSQNSVVLKSKDMNSPAKDLTVELPMGRVRYCLEASFPILYV